MIARRAALGALGSGLAALLARPNRSEARARKRKRKGRRKKKPALNEFGCVNVGGRCRGNDALCCSGICAGKKPRKGKRDKSTCLDHNALTCPDGANACVEGEFAACEPNGFCFQTTGMGTFCGIPAEGVCAACTRDTDCEAGLGPGAACIICPGPCQASPHTACVPPAG